MNRFLATAAIALALCAPAAAHIDCQILCAPTTTASEPTTEHLQAQYLACNDKSVEVFAFAQNELKALGNLTTRSKINAFNDITRRGFGAESTMDSACSQILEGRDVDYLTLAANLISYIKGED
jgi:hypothetical protein